jgi:hypothetical protein
MMHHTSQYHIANEIVANDNNHENVSNYQKGILDISQYIHHILPIAFL